MGRRPVVELHTIFAVAEGETEEAFLAHLKRLYVSRGNGISVKIGCCYGGSPHDMVQEVARKKKMVDYHETFLLLDSDVVCTSETKSEAQKHGVELIFSNPCVEGLFLQILDTSQNWKSKNAKDCEREFHSRFLNESQKLESERYSDIFKREVLEEARMRIPSLDLIIKKLTEK